MKIESTYFVLAFVIGLHMHSFSQNSFYTDSIFNSNIHTVDLHPTHNYEALAVASLGSIETLSLSFDELGNNYKNYTYRFVHCNANWQQSALSISEYLEGFEEGTIENYAFSQNTKINYTHYQLSFPKEDMQPLVSGNYILQVYEENQAEKPAMQLRFLITENRTPIDGLIKQSDQALYRSTHQEIDFKVNIQGLANNFPAKDISVNIMQNTQWENLKTNIHSEDIRDNMIYFDLHNQNNTFWGLNRFRYFDFSSQKYNSEYIDRIITEGDTTRIVLLGSKSRRKDKFAEQINMRGAFLISTKDWEDAQIESEYSMVYFTLYYPVPLPDAEVYIMGAFNQWKANTTNKMQYDYKLKAYVGQLLLKQGFYSYLFMLRDHQAHTDDYVFFENSFFDTDNIYNLMVYYRTPGTLYDRLVGYSRLK